MSKNNPLPLLQITSIPGASSLASVNEAFEQSGDEESVNHQYQPRGKSTIKPPKEQVRKKRPKVTRKDTFTISRPSATASATTSNKSSGSVTIDIEPPIASVSSDVDGSAQQSILQLPSTAGSSTVIFMNNTYGSLDENVVNYAPKKGERKLAEEEGASASFFVNRALEPSDDEEFVLYEAQPRVKSQSKIKPRKDHVHKKVSRSATFTIPRQRATTSAETSNETSGSVTIDIEPPIATGSNEVNESVGQPILHLASTPGSSAVTSPHMSYGSLNALLDPERGEPRNTSRKGDEPSKNVRRGASFLNSIQSATSSVVTFIKSRGPVTSEKSRPSPANSIEEHELETRPKLVPGPVSGAEGEERKPNGEDGNETRSGSLPSAATSAATSRVTRRKTRDSSPDKIEELQDETTRNHSRRNVSKSMREILKKRRNRQKGQNGERIFLALLISAAIFSWFGTETEQFAQNEKSLSITISEIDLSNSVVFNNCWPLAENFDFQGFARATGQKIDKEPGNLNNLIEKLIQSSSNEKVFEFVRLPSDLVSSCAGRHIMSAHNGYETIPGDVCSKNRITKYLKQTSVCVRYNEMKSRHEVWYTEVRNDPDHPGVIRSVTLNLKAMKGNVTPFYSVDDQVPYAEWLRATELDLSQYDLEKNGVEIEVRYRMVCEETSSTFPFKQCDSRRRYDVINECISNKTIETYGKVPPVAFINSTTTSSHPMLTAKELRENETLNRGYNEIIDQCNRDFQDIESCSNCHIETTYKFRGINNQTGTATYILVIPKDPSVTFTRKPVTTFSAYLLAVITIIGVCVGLSLYLVLTCCFKWNRYQKDGRFLLIGWKSDEIDPETQQKMEIAELKEDNKQHKEDNKQLMESVGALTAAISGLHALQGDGNDPQTMQQEIAKLDERNKQLQKALSMLTGELTSLKQVLNPANPLPTRTVAKQNQQIAELVDQNRLLEEALSKLKEEIRSIKLMLNSANSQPVVVCPPQSVTATIHPPPSVSGPAHTGRDSPESRNPVPSPAPIPATSSAAEDGSSTPRPDLSSLRIDDLAITAANQKQEIAELVERFKLLEEAQFKFNEGLRSILLMLNSDNPPCIVLHPPQSSSASLHPAPPPATVPLAIPSTSAAKRDYFPRREDIFKRLGLTESSLSQPNFPFDAYKNALQRDIDEQRKLESQETDKLIKCNEELKEQMDRIQRKLDATRSVRLSPPTSPVPFPNLAADGLRFTPRPYPSSSDISRLAGAAVGQSFNQEIKEWLDRMHSSLQQITFSVQDSPKSAPENKSKRSD